MKPREINGLASLMAAAVTVAAGAVLWAGHAVAPAGALSTAPSQAVPPQAATLMTSATMAPALPLAALQIVPGRRRGGRRGRGVEIPDDDAALNAPYDGRFHFARVRYTPWMEGMRWVQGGGPSWAHDYPRGEFNFMKIIDEVTYVHPLVGASNVLALDDPRLMEYPVAYMIEVAGWYPTGEEVQGLHDYLLKGGFLIIDDFRFPFALDNLRFQMNRVLPEGRMVLLDGSEEIFDSFFRVDPHEVIPPYDRGQPEWYGIYEDNDPQKRLLMIANYDNDISEYWEWSDQGLYGIDLTNEAYKLGVNYIVYGMTH